MDTLRKNITKKVVSLFLVVVMLVGTISMSSNAEGTSTDTATITDLYDIIKDTEIISPTGNTLGTLEGTENVGWKMKVDLSQATADAKIGLANDTSTFWTSTGYAVNFARGVNEIQILAKTDTNPNKIVVARKWISGLKTASFELEMGVVNQYNEGSNEVSARKVYVKKDGVEVVSYIDEDTDHVLGNNICIGSISGVKLNSIDYKREAIDIYDYAKIAKTLDDMTLGLSNTIGQLPKTSNVGYRIKIDMTSAQKKDSAHNTSLYIGLNNTALVGSQYWVFDGYRLCVDTDKMELQVMTGDDSDAKVYEPVSGVNKSAFDLEMGVQDIVKVGDDTVVAHRVYVKKDGTEVIKYLDTNLNRPVGTYIRTLYTNEDIVGTVDYRDCVIHDVTVYDFYTVLGKSETTINSPSLGKLPRSTNVGWKAKLDLSTSKGERLLGLSNAGNAFWSSTGYAIDVNADRNIMSIFALEGTEDTSKSNVASVSCSGLASEFVLEFGVADVYSPTTNEVIARRVYAKKDGTEVLSYLDWYVDVELGTTIYHASSTGITVSSVDYANENPVAQLGRADSQILDYYDFSGEISHNQSNGTFRIGGMPADNSSFKAKVNIPKTTDADNQILLTIGSTDRWITAPADGSGYQFWFIPAQGKLTLLNVIASSDGLGSGSTQQVATKTLSECPEEFDMVLGTRQVLFSNGDVYGTEVYALIDGQQVVSWIDCDKDKVLGTHAVCYKKGSNTVEFSSYYSVLSVGDNVSTQKVDIVTTEGSELPTGWIDGKYIIDWTYQGQNVQTYQVGTDSADYVANYIDEKMLNVKVQKKTEDNGSVTARFIGSLDDYRDEDYECVGFVLSTKNQDPLQASNYFEKDINIVWDALYVAGELRTASDIYDSYSKQLFALDVQGLKADSVVYARAYVKLKDGTMVYGKPCTKNLSELYELVDFVVTVEDEKEPVVLQLTDTQLINSTYTDGLPAKQIPYYEPDNYSTNCFSYIKETIEATNPDLILITGDVIYGKFDHDGQGLLKFINYMDSFEIPWAPVFGNHENESAMGADWQSQQLESSRYCLFKQRQLTGNGNYTVAIEQNNKLKRVFFMMDSNGCSGMSEATKANGHSQTTKGFAQDQIDWYTKVAQDITKLSPETKYSFAFHIATQAFADAYAKYGFSNGDSSGLPINIDLLDSKEDGDFGIIAESNIAQWDMNNSVFEGLKAIGVDSIFVGHNHCMSSSVVYEGVRLQFGQKTGTYDQVNYLQSDGTLIQSYPPASGKPLSGGTVMKLSNTDATIKEAFIYLCK